MDGEDKESEDLLVQKAQAAISALYSSWMPKPARDYIASRVTAGFPRQYQRLQEAGLEGNVPESHMQELCGKTWQIKTMFKPEVLNDFIAAFHIPSSWSREMWLQDRINVGHVTEDLGICLGRMPRKMSISMIRWETEHIVLPFGYKSDEEFNILNP